jgi:hypothetical protein
MKRFWSKVNILVKDGCWNWIAGKSKLYGSFYFQGMMHPAHRIAWILTHGSIPKEKEVLHRCDNPLCVNPNHLFLGSQFINNRDRAIKQRNGITWRPLLAKDKVIDIQRLARNGERKDMIAQRYKISLTTVYRILGGYGGYR